MGDGTRDATAAEYVTVLRGFGLSEAEVAELHAPDGGDDAIEAVRSAVAGSRPSALHERLRTTLVRSRHGTVVDADAGVPAAVSHVAGLLEPYGCDLSVTGGDGSLAGGPYELSVTDAEGDTRTTTYEPPTGRLGEHNTPALVDAVERELLADVALTVQLLAGDEDWRLVLLPASNLATARDRWGERIAPFEGDRPLLAARQPADYADGAPDPAESVGSGDLLAAITDEDGEPDESAVDAAVAALEAAEDGPRAVRSERSVDEVFDAVEESDPAAVAESAWDAPRTTRIENDDVERVLGDLSDVDLSPERDAVGGGPDRVVSEDDPVAMVGAGPVETTSEDDWALPNDEGETDAAAGSETAPSQPSAGASDDGGATSEFGQLSGGAPDRVVAEESVDEVLDSVAADDPEAVMDAGAAPVAPDEDPAADADFEAFSADLAAHDPTTDDGGDDPDATDTDPSGGRPNGIETAADDPDEDSPESGFGDRTLINAAGRGESDDEPSGLDAAADLVGGDDSPGGDAVTDTTNDGTTTPNERDQTEASEWEAVPELRGESVEDERDDDTNATGEEVVVSRLGDEETPEGALLGGGDDADHEVVNERRPETDGAGDPDRGEDGLVDRLESTVESVFSN